MVVMVVQFGKFSQNKFSQHCAVALPPAATKSSFSLRPAKSVVFTCVFRCVGKRKVLQKRVLGRKKGANATQLLP